MAVDDAHPVNIGLLQALLQQTQPLYLASAGGEIAFANDAYRQLVAGEPDGESDDRRMLPLRHRDAVAEVLTTKAPLVRREVFVTSEAGQAMLASHVPVFDSAARVVAVSGSFSDVGGEIALASDAATENSRLHDVARAATDWLWETDHRGRLSVISSRVALSVGMPAQRLRGRLLFDLCRHPNDGAASSPLSTPFHEATAFRDLLVRIDAANGDQRLCHLSGVPYFDADGRFAGFRGTGTDVTQYLRAAEAVKETNRQLELTLEELHRKNLELDQALAESMMATKAKDSFLASMSHELRTPLNAILGFAEIMQLGLFGKLNEQYTGYAGDIIGAGRHLLRLVDDILDIARIESDKLPLALEPISAQEIIADVTALVRNNASKRQIEIVPLPTRPDYDLRGDRTRVIQILTNLMSNAIKYTPPGGRFGVSLGVTSDWPGMVEITVWDTGPGIASVLQDQVFETFNRGDRDALEHVGEGVGIGLSLARRLAQLMGGDVRLKSTLGEGCEFTMSLPRDVDDGTADRAPEETEADRQGA